MRYSAGARSTGAGSSTLPIGSLYASATGGGRVRELGAFNTTAVALAIRLVRLTNTGTPGTGLAEAPHDLIGNGAQMTAFDTHSADPTSGMVDLGYRTAIGAAIGAGIVWTFGDSGIVIPKDATEGIGILPVGTGQILDWYVVWDE